MLGKFGRIFYELSFLTISQPFGLRVERWISVPGLEVKLSPKSTSFVPSLKTPRDIQDIQKCILRLFLEIYSCSMFSQNTKFH